MILMKFLEYPVLIIKGLKNIALQHFNNYFIPNYKNIKEEQVLNVIILFDLLKLLNKSIDIDIDKIYINFLVSNLDFIKNNYNKVQEINDKSKPKKFILHYFSLIQDCHL